MPWLCLPIRLFSGCFRSVDFQGVFVLSIHYIYIIESDALAWGGPGRLVRHPHATWADPLFFLFLCSCRTSSFHVGVSYPMRPRRAGAAPHPERTTPHAHAPHTQKAKKKKMPSDIQTMVASGIQTIYIYCASEFYAVSRLERAKRSRFVFLLY